MSATLLSDNTGLKDLLTCPICLEPFKNPRNFPCGHNFCLSCIEDLIQSSNRDTIECATCRESYDRSWFARRGIQRNYALEAVIEHFENNSLQNALLSSPSSSPLLTTPPTTSRLSNNQNPARSLSSSSHFQGNHRRTQSNARESFAEAQLRKALIEGRHLACSIAILSVGCFTVYSTSLVLTANVFIIIMVTALAYLEIVMDALRALQRQRSYKSIITRVARQLVVLWIGVCFCTIIIHFVKFVVLMVPFGEIFFHSKETITKVFMMYAWIVEGIFDFVVPAVAMVFLHVWSWAVGQVVYVLSLEFWSALFDFSMKFLSMVSSCTHFIGSTLLDVLHWMVFELVFEIKKLGVTLVTCTHLLFNMAVKLITLISVTAFYIFKFAFHSLMFTIDYILIPLIRFIF
eukprot:TRINITY_DN4589_c0_g1_i1.p1 TRINITY_DN4589_c0_g1~~TRINITY_DN4589_c0_g1_i1.p1  ORF type:complete len:404 (+),score=77.65 TRINITY_DN4589_c0_g1_i1:49-1260(+)